MAKPLIREQIFLLNSAKKNFPEYRQILSFQEKMLKILLPLDESLKRGVKKKLTKKNLDSLLEKTISSKIPICNFFSVSDFDIESILNATKNIVQLLIDEKINEEELNTLAEKLNNTTIISEAIEAILREDATWFKHQSKRFDVDSTLLLLIFDSPLKPFFEEISRNVEDRIKETWLDYYCPICGRQSSVAINRKLKRYMRCPYCGLDYLVDPFVCVNCGNNDPTTMGFININRREGFELNYCEKCNHYIKIVIENLTLQIPPGLEDILTRELDNIAVSSDLSFRRI